MSEQNDATPAVPATAEAPATKADYLAAALKAMETDPIVEPPESAEPPAPPPPEAQAEAPKEEPKAAPIKEEPKESPLDRSFKTLAEQQAAMRKERDALKEREAKIKALEEAAASGDPLKVLEASGTSWKKLAERIMQDDMPVDADEGKPAPKVKEAPPEYLTKLEQLELEVQQMRAETARNKIYGLARDVLKSDKFELLREFSNEDAVVDALTEHFRRTEQPPGASMRESIEIVAQALSENLEESRKRWEGFLTKKKASSNVSAGSQAPKSVTTSAGRVGESNLSYRDASAPRVPSTSSETEPQTAEDYRNAALKAWLANEAG